MICPAGGPPFAIFEGCGFVPLTAFVHHSTPKTLYLLGAWCRRFENNAAWDSRFCGGSLPKGRRLGQPRKLKSEERIGRGSHPCKERKDGPRPVVAPSKEIKGGPPAGLLISPIQPHCGCPVLRAICEGRESRCRQRGFLETRNLAYATRFRNDIFLHPTFTCTGPASSNR